MRAPRVTLLSRPGCHLCDDARDVIRRVADELGVGWEERDITQSADDLREYWEKIPVTLVDGVQHDFWRVSEDRLRSALTGDSARRLWAIRRARAFIRWP
jgi:glutaredoxin